MRTSDRTQSGEPFGTGHSEARDWAFVDFAQADVP
jgi:hypothetical protein